MRLSEEEKKHIIIENEKVQINLFFGDCAFALGHFVIQPKDHANDISKLTKDEWKTLSKWIPKVAKAMKKTLKGVSGREVEKIYLCSFNESKGWPVHFHLVPRYKNENLMGPKLLSNRTKAKLDISSKDRDNLVYAMKKELLAPARNIALLGWGSLIWNPRGLKISGSWKGDGPLLPIEFARISKDKSLTLVLYHNASDVQTLWAKTCYTNLSEAVNDLADRENTSSNCIGYVSVTDNRRHCQVVPRVLAHVRHWVEEKRLDAVVWTDLPSNFREERKVKLTQDNIIGYLKSLKGDALNRAEKYVRKAPKQIQTRFRSGIEKELGWSPYSKEYSCGYSCSHIQKRGGGS